MAFNKWKAKYLSQYCDNCVLCVQVPCYDSQSSLKLYTREQAFSPTLLTPTISRK